MLAPPTASFFPSRVASRMRTTQNSGGVCSIQRIDGSTIIRISLINLRYKKTRQRARTFLYRKTKFPLENIGNYADSQLTNRDSIDEGEAKRGARKMEAKLVEERVETL